MGSRGWDLGLLGSLSSTRYTRFVLLSGLEVAHESAHIHCPELIVCTALTAREPGKYSHSVCPEGGDRGGGHLASL